MHQLYTPRGQALTGIPWDIYPRPQLRRDSYVNLNGPWEFSAGDFRGTICVPFCPESALSGVGRHFPEGTELCYRRRFPLFPELLGGRVLLHIGAADQQSECYVNDQAVGTHLGGYEAMTFDITDALREENELRILVRDDLNRRSQPYGKQTKKPGGMWYTPVSGIWQTVWLERVPENYIRSLRIENRGYTVTVTTQPKLSGTVTVPGLGTFPLADGSVTIAPEHPRLWSPEDPYLYDFTLETETDRVESYFAIRSIEARQVNGIPRLCLNGRPYFFHGLLDQGYWPDGIFTPADPACYSDDILAMKDLGFNMLRKHIKVEAPEFYYQCDKLGMVVFQDMVNNGAYHYLPDTVLPTLGIQRSPDRNMHKDPATRQAFLDAMAATVRQLQNHPSILYWTVFNEGWGQFDSDRVYEQLKALDDTRIIDTTSGWFRQSKTDVESLHIYFDLWHRLKPTDKPLVLSEFGGYTYPVAEHLACPEKAYGYKTCKTLEALQQAFEALYRSRILPAIPKGLCAAVYTQLSDVEEEINGLLTYDRRICKADKAAMKALSADLQSAICAPATSSR